MKECSILQLMLQMASGPKRSPKQKDSIVAPQTNSTKKQAYSYSFFGFTQTDDGYILRDFLPPKRTPKMKPTTVSKVSDALKSLLFRRSFGF